MPVIHHIDAERRRVVATVRGEFTLSDIVEAIDAAVHDPAFEPGFDVLSDHTGVARPITTEQLEAMVQHLGSLAARVAGARWAVVTSAPASFGMMRMLSVYAKRIPIEVQVFRRAEDAEPWLSSPRPDR